MLAGVDGGTSSACPRYFGAALSHVQTSQIQLTWTGASELRVEVDHPRLEWEMSMVSSPLLRVLNGVSPRLPGRLWRSRAFFIANSHAELEGTSLGFRVRLRENPLMGSMGLPPRPTFMGDGYLRILDQDEYERTAGELRRDDRHDWMDGRESACRSQ